LNVIDKGGMGALYRVSDEVRDGEVLALKMVRLKDASDDERIEHFQREFQLLTQLRHPNLVSVYDYGVTAEGEVYFTMEWIEGQDLEPHGHRLEPEYHLNKPGQTRSGRSPDRARCGSVGRPATAPQLIEKIRT